MSLPARNALCRAKHDNYTEKIFPNRVQTHTQPRRGELKHLATELHCNAINITRKWPTYYLTILC